MDIKEEMLLALKHKKGDTFNLGSDLVYKNINVGKIREMIGYPSLDITEDIKCEVLNIKGITCYKYFKDDDKKYILFNIHGGGFYGGGAKVVENNSKYLAKNGITVVSIEYTLAPEKQYPNIMIEIYDVIKEYLKDNKYDKVGVIGDSAGGMLALNVATLDDENIIDFLCLYYPVISLTEKKQVSFDNLGENAKASILFLKSVMPLVTKLYLPDNKSILEDSEYGINSKYYNCLNIDKKLPEIQLIKAEFDYFNDEIDKFCNKYDIKAYECKGLSHGFMELLGYLPEVKDILDLTVKHFKNKVK